MTDNTSFAFNRRYLVIGVFTYILSAYIALSLYPLSSVNTRLISVYSIAFVLILLTIFTVLTASLRKNRELFSLCIYCIAFVFIFVAGYLYSCKYIYSIDTQNEIISSHPRIYGTVKSEPTLSSSGKTLCITVDVYTASDRSTSINLDEPCLVNVYIPASSDSELLRFGNSVSFEFNSELITQAAYTGGFDYNRYLRQDGICYVGYPNLLKEHSPLAPKNPLRFRLETAGLKIRDFILDSTNLSAYNPDEYSLLRGILVGDTENFSDSLYADYTDSGFVHIVSVSGMHTSYLFMALSIILGLVRIPKRAIRLIAIPILIIFTSVALFTPSVCRAVIMMIVLVIASLLRRNNDSITALSIAALILVYQNPYCLESYSFLLSFGATLGILVYLAPLQKRLHFAIMKRPPYSKRNFPKRILYRLNRFSVDSVCLSLGATIGIAYFASAFFGRIQWGNIIGNILIFPMTAVSFIGGYINSVIYHISPKIAYGVAKIIINPSLWGINRLSQFFSHSFFRLEVPPPPAYFFIIYIFICVCLYYLLMPSKHKTDG